MAQKRLRNYQHSILSFEHNTFNLGMHSPGRYIGFDTINKIAGLQFYLTHTGKNLSYMDPNNVTTGPIGVFLTPQGAIIMETSNVGPFSLDSNAGNTNYRYDLIYAIHNQVELAGGQDATYAVIKGSMAAPTKPNIPDILKNTIIGYVEIPPNEPGDINNCNWLKAKCPDSGDGPDARLDDVNIFNKYQGIALSPTIYKLPTIISASNNSFWQLGNDGNIFKIFPDSVNPQNLDAILISKVTPTEGNRIYLHINEKVKMYKSNILLDVDEYNAGYRSFNIRDQFFNTTTDPNGFPLSRPALNPGAGEVWEITLVFMDNTWVVTDIGGKRAIKPTAPNTGDYEDNITTIVPGTNSNEFGIYTKPSAPIYPVLFVSSYHVGDLKDPGLDYPIDFGKDLGTVNYTVLGSLRKGSGIDNNANCVGVWAVMQKNTTGIIIHVNEYAHNITQDLYFDFVIIRNY